MLRAENETQKRKTKDICTCSTGAYSVKRFMNARKSSYRYNAKCNSKYRYETSLIVFRVGNPETSN